MSDHESPSPQQKPDIHPTAAQSGESAHTPLSSQPTGAPVDDTVGMGTTIALGCIGATVFLIALGLIYLLVVQFLG